MKKPLLSAFLLLAIAGCKKEKYTCEHNIYYIRPLNLAFAGFTPAELDTIVVSSYTGNTSMTDLIRTDTILSVAPLFQNNIAYAPDSTNGTVTFPALKNNVDYQVNVVSAARLFAVTGASTGPSFHRWTQETRCSPGAYQPEIYTLLNIHVDGQPVSPHVTPNYGHFILLNK